MQKECLIDRPLLIESWKGHRNLTRKVIEAFPEKELFEFKVANMRTFADMVKELLSLDVPGLESIIANNPVPYNHNLPYNDKASLLAAWDASCANIDELLMQIPMERFPENFNMFNEYNFPIIQNIMYFMDNQIHHRGQGFVYLRLLGIEPPFFWERQ